MYYLDLNTIITAGVVVTLIYELYINVFTHTCSQLLEEM